MKGKLLPWICVLLAGAVVVTLVVVFNSCSNKKGSLFPEPVFTTELMEDYVKTKAELKDTLPDEYSAYLDFSDGVNLAYDDTQTKEILRAILNSLSGNGKKYYCLADHKMDTIPGTPEDIFKKATDPKEYRRQAAPIRMALDHIVKDGKPAILITDYEEYDGNTIHKGAFAKRFFVDWLKHDSNSITFFIVNYTEKGKDKKLFFTIFDGNPNRLTDKITRALQGKASNYTKFVMSNSYYEVQTDYPAANKGGNYHNEAGFDNVTCVQEEITEVDRYTLMPQYKAEYYPLLSSYVEILENASAVQDPSKPYPPFSFGSFIQHIYFNFSNFAYKDVTLGLHVTNAQADYTKYFDYIYALSQPKPELGTVDDPYFDEYQKVRAEFVYAEQPEGEVKDIFEIYDNPSEKDPNAKIIPDFHEYGIYFQWDKFDGTVIDGANLTDLIRIDVVIKDVEDKDTEELEPLFKWGDYDNLSESVRLALQEVRPIGKVVYTFYVRSNSDKTK